MRRAFTMMIAQSFGAVPKALAVLSLSLCIVTGFAAASFAHDGGSDSGSGRDERDRSDLGDRSGPGGGEDRDRSGEDRGSSGDREGPTERANDRGGSSGSGSGERVPTYEAERYRDSFAIWRNERGERVRGGEVILVSTRKDVAERVAAIGYRILEDQKLNAVGMRVLRIAVRDGETEEEVIEGLRAVDPKATATFNHIYEPASTALPFTVTAASRARAKRTRATIGLVDASVAAGHAMLQDVTITQRRFGETSAKGAGHGTAVASRLALAAPGATIVAADVFTLELDGQHVASAFAVVSALDWLARKRIAVINLSLTGPENPVLQRAVARLTAKGHVLVAAVGNEGPRGAPQYPAAYDNVVGVTAVDAERHVYKYANQGDYVDFAAEGVDAPAATSAASIEAVSGTSYAAPIVAAAFARRVSEPSPKLAKRALNALRREARDLGAPGRDPVYGFGLIRGP